LILQDINIDDKKLGAYTPSFLFRSGHMATMYPYGFRKSPDPTYNRTRCELPDGDFVDLDYVRKGHKQVVLLLHGLEGSSSSQYILGLVHALRNLPIDICAINHRSCSGEMNRTVTFYHSGFTADISYVLHLLSKEYDIVSAIGFSLGGNAILKYLGSHTDIPQNFITALAVSAPIDLASSAVRLNHWSNMPYAIQFLKSLNKKIKSKARQMPHLLNENDYNGIYTLYEYDERVTAKLHGFSSANDYYVKSSAKPFLANIKHQTLLINAEDDTFLAPPCFPFEEAREHPYFHFYASPYGGHVGFSQFKDGDTWLDKVAVAWLSSHLKMF
jgi:uncharacterized protein